MGRDSHTGARRWPTHTRTVSWAIMQIGNNMAVESEWARTEQPESRKSRESRNARLLLLINLLQWYKSNHNLFAYIRA